MKAAEKSARTLIVCAMLASSGVVTGCGNDAATSEAPRPVLVTRPGIGLDAANARYPGEVRAREESALAFRVGGKLVRRHVDVGDTVRAGQVLAEMDPGDLRLQAGAAQAQAAAAEAELRRTSAERERYQTLLDAQLISRSAFDQAETAYQAAIGQADAARANLAVARNQAGYAELRAPRAGVIASRQIEAGQVLAAGQTAFTFSADGAREVAIALPEADIDDIRVGQRVEIDLWSKSGRSISGTIRLIAPAADPQTRTYAARVALAPEAAGAVKLGQSAEVRIQSGRSTKAVNVPLSALQRDAPGAGAAVWVVDPKTSRLRLQSVRIGAYGADQVAVLSGLTRNDLVVMAGGHLLRDGQQVVPVDRWNRPVGDRSAAAADRPVAAPAR